MLMYTNVQLYIGLYNWLLYFLANNSLNNIYKGYIIIIPLCIRGYYWCYAFEERVKTKFHVHFPFSFR